MDEKLKRDLDAFNLWWNDHEPEHLVGADKLSALSGWKEAIRWRTSTEHVSESEWQRRAEMLRVKLSECQAFLDKAVQDGKKHAERADRFEDELKAHPRMSVLAGLDLAREHIEAQKNVWRSTDTPPEVVLDMLLKNIAALKTLVIEGKLPK